MPDLLILLIVLIVLIVLLRPRALPELGRALGEAIRGVREGSRGDDEPRDGQPPAAG